MIRFILENLLSECDECASRGEKYPCRVDELYTKCEVMDSAEEEIKKLIPKKRTVKL